MFGFKKRRSDGGLCEAVTQGDPVTIAQLIYKQDFTLIEESSSGPGGKSPLTVDVDGAPALVAFTSGDNAGRFAGRVPELLGADGTLPAFVVGGADFLKHLPDGFGVLLNPESNECVVIPPALADRVKGARRRGGPTGP